MHEDIHFDFLSELGALDEFLARRSEGERFVQPEDPDVRRLLEALAFFSARTRASASAELRASVRRLAQGLLDEFIQPQPARAMLWAQPSARLTEPASLPRGSRVRLETLDGDVGHFSTMRDLTLRPLELDRAELQPRSGGGYRVLLRLRSFGPTAPSGERLSLHVDHLGDYGISRLLFARLRRHLARVGVVYGEPPAASESGLDRIAEGGRRPIAGAQRARLESTKLELASSPCGHGGVEADGASRALRTTSNHSRGWRSSSIANASGCSNERFRNALSLARYGHRRDRGRRAGPTHASSRGFSRSAQQT